MTMTDITYAQEGETFHALSDDRPEDRVTVAGWHEATGPNTGRWICERHGTLRNNSEASSHGRAGHRLAWLCFDHNAIEQATRAESESESERRQADHDD